MRSQHGFMWFGVVALFVAGVLQSSELITAWGVKPNLILVLLAVFSLFAAHWFSFAVLAIFGATIVHFAPGFSWESAAIVLLAFLFFYVRDRFLSAGLLVSVLFVMFGTVFFYLLVSPSVLYDEVGVIAHELVYNVLLGVIFFFISDALYEKKGGSSV